MDEQNWQTQPKQWLDKHPLRYWTIVIIAMYVVGGGFGLDAIRALPKPAGGQIKPSPDYVPGGHKCRPDYLSTLKPPKREAQEDTCRQAAETERQAQWTIVNTKSDIENRAVNTHIALFLAIFTAFGAPFTVAGVIAGMLKRS